jgi:bifunctional ADP-heptose synthase (sugar kinase/adenylyltransferase)
LSNLRFTDQSSLIKILLILLFILFAILFAILITILIYRGYSLPSNKSSIIVTSIIYLGYGLTIHKTIEFGVDKFISICLTGVNHYSEKGNYKMAEDFALQAFKTKSDEKTITTYGRAILSRMCDELEKSKNELNILAIGDIMLDRVLQGHHVTSPRVAIHQLVSKTYMLTDKMSETNSIGGIGYLSHALWPLVKNVTMIGVIGTDFEGQVLQEICNGKRDFYGRLIKVKDEPIQKIEFCSISIEDIITTNKIYFIYPDPNNPNGKKAIRFDREDVDLIVSNQTSITKEFIKKFDDIIAKYNSQSGSGTNEFKIDCIVIDDYEKGLLTKDLMNYIGKVASENNIDIYIDPKNNWKKFEDCPIKAILPNRHECNSALHTEKPKENDISPNLKKVSEFVIKKDCDGAYFYNNEKKYSYEVRPFGENKEAIDVGCGVVFDAYYIASRLCDNSIEESTFLANYAAGLKTIDPKIGEIVSLETVIENLNNEQDYFTKNKTIIEAISNLNRNKKEKC